MEDRQRLFLDKIVNLLVDDTILEYEKGRIYYPFSLSSALSIFLLSPPLYSFSPWPSFSEYCINNYGLTGNEIEYVWNEYKSIIRDKFKNNER